MERSEDEGKRVSGGDFGRRRGHTQRMGAAAGNLRSGYQDPKHTREPAICFEQAQCQGTRWQVAEQFSLVPAEIDYCAGEAIKHSLQASARRGLLRWCNTAARCKQPTPASVRSPCIVAARSRSRVDSYISARFRPSTRALQSMTQRFREIPAGPCILPAPPMFARHH